MSTVRIDFSSDAPESPVGRVEGEDGPAGAALDSLMVGVDGQIAGLIHFRRSARLGRGSDGQG